MNKKVEGQTQSYIIFGILTTLVNFISYVFFTKVSLVDYKIATSLAWLIAVLFAFITNKIYVFKSHEMDAVGLAREFSSFLFFRLLSYFIDLASIIILVEHLGIFDTVSKILASVIVAIVNYFASKHVVFRLKTNEGA